eukprot:343660-Chlamydomonas_euryale.AAC.4
MAQPQAFREFRAWLTEVALTPCAGLRQCGALSSRACRLARSTCSANFAVEASKRKPLDTISLMISIDFM